MASNTNLKLPDGLKARVAALAKETGRSRNSVMVDAIQCGIEREERMRAFVKVARKADHQTDMTREVYAASDVHDWLKKLASTKQARRSKSRRG